MTQEQQNIFGEVTRGYDAVVSNVRGFSRKRRAWRFLHDLGLYITLTLGILLLWAVADWLLPLPHILVLSGAGIAGLAIAGGLLYWLVKVLLRRETLHWEAVHVEQLHKSLDNSLIGTIQLVEEAKLRPDTYSLDLIAALVNRTAEVLKAERLGKLLDRRPGIRMMAASAAVVACSLALVLFSAGFIEGRIESISKSYIAMIETIWPVELLVAPGDRTVLRDEHSVKLALEIRGGHYDAATMIAENEEGEVVIETEVPLSGIRSSMKGELQLAAETVSSVDRFMTYRFVAGKHESRTHTIRVVERPRIENIAADLHFPTYTQMMPQQITGMFGNIRALSETVVSLSLAANKPLLRASIIFGGDLEAQQPLDISGRFATTQFVVQENMNTEAELQLTCEDGFPMREAFRFRVQAVPDEAPEIEILLSGGERLLLRDQVSTFSFPYTVSDDFGVAQVQVHYEIEAVDRTLGRGRRTGEMPPLTFSRPERRMRGVMNRPFAEIELQPGDRMKFWMVATDNNTQTGPRTGRSMTHEFVVVLPNLAGYREEQFDWAFRRSLLLGELEKVRRNTDFLQLPQRRVSAEDTPAAPKHRLAAHVPPESWPAGVEQAVTDYLQLLSTHARD